jgi:hypothetical protein
MKALKKVLSFFVMALVMTTSLNVLAAEPATKKAPEAVEEAVKKGEEALSALKSGASAEEVNKLIKATAEATSEIYSNYKSEKVRDTSIIKLKAVRKQVTAGDKTGAEEGLQKAIDDIKSIKGMI